MNQILNQVILVTAKKYDVSNVHDPEEFNRQLINNEENEKLIFDKTFQEIVISKGFKTEEEKEKFKKEFNENILKSISSKIELLTTLGHNLNQDIIINYEYHVLKSFGYTKDEYISAIQESIKNKEYNSIILGLK